MNQRRDKDPVLGCYLSVDGTDCPINEPRRGTHGIDPRYYSHKLNSAGLRYQLITAASDGAPLGLSGPYPAGRWPDLRIYRHSIKRELLPEEKVIVDGGYRDQADSHLLNANALNSEAERALFARVRCRHEVLNGRFKSWSVMSDRYRHSLESHGGVARAVLNCVAYDIRHGHPLFL